MYTKYLKKVYKLYKRIEKSYTQCQAKCKTKKKIYHVIAKDLGIPLIDVEAAIAVIEERQSLVFKEKAEYLISSYIANIVAARAEHDSETIDKIMFFLKKELSLSTNTINKYIKIVIFQDAIAGGAIARPWDLRYPLSSTLSFVPSLSISNISKEDENVQDKLEESMGETEAGVEEDPQGTESVSSEEDHIETLRKELVCELFNNAECECVLDESLLTRFIRKVKSFFKGE